MVVACSDESDDLPKVGEILTFDLEDLNDLSTTFGQMIGPHTFTPKVTMYYFTNKEKLKDEQIRLKDLEIQRLKEQDMQKFKEELIEEQIKEEQIKKDDLN